jgi:hypothetical protein
MRLWPIIGVVTAAAVDDQSSLLLQRLVMRMDRLESDNAALQGDNAALKRNISALASRLDQASAPGPGPLAGELRIFEADECPHGWTEHNSTQGYLLTGRPKHGKAGTRINRPLDAGEAARSPEHTHAATVTDGGHTHLADVNDPGHLHKIDDSGHSHLTYQFNSPQRNGGPGPNGISWGTAMKNPPPRVETQGAKTGINTSKLALTGIQVSNQPAESNVHVSLDANDGGEGYPLVYVLVCQRSS